MTCDDVKMTIARHNSAEDAHCTVRTHMKGERKNI